ncbi:MAG: hypothetical protein SNJ70_04965 [Armatimonadota bacterium]
MKLKIMCFLFVSAFLLTSAIAHAPDKITIGFDEKSKIITVNISHQVKSPNEHYIKEVEIYRNGKEIISQKFTSQPTASGLKVQYSLPDHKKGDKYKIEAYCNKTGELEAVYPQ